MDLIELATQLALAIQQDDRYFYLDSARNMNDQDEELQQQIGEFNLARIDLNAEINRTEKDNEKIKELNEKVNAIYGDIMSNESMVAYNEAKHDMDALMQHINAILTTAVNGGDPAAVQAPSSCGGDCAGCGGGCH